MALFVDPLALQLIVLGVTGVLLFYHSLRAFMRVRSGGRPEHGQIWPLLLFIGIYAFLTGLWGHLVWPLPGSYNILFYDPYPIFGLLLMVFSLLLKYDSRLEYAGLASFLFGAVTVYYGYAGYAAGMTKQPSVLLALYALWGLAGMVAYPFAMLMDRLRFMPADTAAQPQKQPPARASGGIALAGRGGPLLLLLPGVIFLLAGLLALYIGANAVPGHLVNFSKWVPP
ncbi:MAG: DUF981 family protein [Nitrososphaerota archaeon]|nr:DUF981 family protein [Nitrososphaerota archaeon]MDG6938954.1 DUF981 family protein [Nitrososphaerota archaeon]